jgi:hypothetical protein
MHSFLLSKTCIQTELYRWSDIAGDEYLKIECISDTLPHNDCSANFSYNAATQLRRQLTAYKAIKVNPKGVIETLQKYDYEYKEYPPYSDKQKEYYNRLRDGRNKLQCNSDV